MCIRDRLTANPEQARLGIANKHIVVKQDQIYISKNFYKELIASWPRPDENAEEAFAVDEKKAIETQTKIVLESLQGLIDRGEIQATFIMYQALQHLIKFPTLTIQRWTVAYVDLLRLHHLYTLANQVIKTSQDPKIRSFNDKNSRRIHTKCGKCKRSNESMSNILCSECKSFTTHCSVCKMPVRGLMLWCQICGHGGHLTEVKQWFEMNNECPTGCGHKCYFSVMTSHL
eukprot:TRINITY_DN3631_c0_g1_i18.p1 TRINITY_DN3631_c0_g1~~TRINITY_DN3631_c0_g1_i18.p1  ORF type:complete len:230 (+),score=22.65 TRINITY_DN3631_c0_g1_i18:67-756(+)